MILTTKFANLEKRWKWYRSGFKAFEFKIAYKKCNHFWNFNESKDIQIQPKKTSEKNKKLEEYDQT